MTSIILYSLAAILLFVSFIKNKIKTKQALKIALKSFEAIMPQFLGIIITVGIVLAFLNPETISNIIGSKSGIFGISISSILGSVTIMPTFVAFSLGNTLLSNGAGYSQVAALVSTLTLVGLATFSLESKYVGTKIALLRNVFAFIFSFIVAFFVGWVMNII